VPLDVSSKQKAVDDKDACLMILTYK